MQTAILKNQWRTGETMNNLINKRELILIRYCLDNAMVNLHADTRKIADSALIKLENQLKED